MLRSVFLGYCIMFPFVLFLNVLSFGGTSFGIGTILFYLLFLTQVILLLFSGKKITLRKELLLFLIPTFIFITKTILSNSGFQVKVFIDQCLLWLIFIFNFVLAYQYADKGFKEKLLKGFYYGSLAAIIIGILHFYFFYSIPFIDTTFDTDDEGTVFYVQNYDLMRFRETSIYFGANVNGYFSVLGFMAFCLVKKYVTVKKPGMVFAGVALLFLLNIINSDSRSALLLFFGFLLLLFFQHSRIIGKILLFSIVPLIVLLIATLNERFSFETILYDPRFTKIAVAFLLMNESPTNWFLGLPMGHDWKIGEISVSDNMYAAILLSYGVIGLTFFIWFLFKNIKVLNKRIKESTEDELPFLRFTKFFLILFFVSGFFSISLSMLPYVAYLGIFLGAAYKKSTQ